MENGHYYHGVMFGLGLGDVECMIGASSRPV